MSEFAHRMETMAGTAEVVKNLFAALGDPELISLGIGAPASEALPVDIVREKFLHSQNVVEESRITIMQSWDHPDLGRLRTGDNVFRGPVPVPGSSWLAYVAQGVMGSWAGSCEALAFQNIDRA